MKTSLKALAVCAGLFAFSAPAFAQSPVLPHTATPHSGMAQAAPQDQPAKRAGTVQEEVDKLRNELNEARDALKVLREAWKKQ